MEYNPLTLKDILHVCHRNQKIIISQPLGKVVSDYMCLALDLFEQKSLQIDDEFYLTSKLCDRIVIGIYPCDEDILVVYLYKELKDGEV